MTPTETTLAWMRSRSDAAQASLSTWGTKLGTWLLVGNAAALVLVLKLATEGPSCADVIIASAKYFSTGIGLAFGGWAVGYLSGIASVLLMQTAINATSTIVTNGDFVERLEAEFGKHYTPGDLEAGIDEAGAEIDKLDGRLKWLLIPIVASVLLFAGSAFSFGKGVMTPLSQPSSLRVCAASKVAAAPEATPLVASKSALDR